MFLKSNTEIYDIGLDKLKHMKCFGFRITEIRFVVPCTTKLVTSSMIPSRCSFVEMSSCKITLEEQTSNEEEVVKGPADFVQT